MQKWGIVGPHVQVSTLSTNLLENADEWIGYGLRTKTRIGKDELRAFLSSPSSYLKTHYLGSLEGVKKWNEAPPPENQLGLDLHMKASLTRASPAATLGQPSGLARCSRCGTELTDSGLYCPSCGKRNEHDTREAAVAKDEEITPRMTSQSSRTEDAEQDEELGL